jgi:hypothetical protein
MIKRYNEWFEYDDEEEDEDFHVGDTVIYHQSANTSLSIDTIKVIDGQTGIIEKIGIRFHVVLIAGRTLWLPIKDLKKV